MEGAGKVARRPTVSRHQQYIRASRLPIQHREAILQFNQLDLFIKTSNKMKFSLALALASFGAAAPLVERGPSIVVGYRTVSKVRRLSTNPEQMPGRCS